MVYCSGERGDEAGHLLLGVQENHQQGRCLRVPRAGTVDLMSLLMLSSARVAQ